jgi:hypothetical protein
VFLWQDSHGNVVATWVGDLLFTLENAPPWQVAHPAEIPTWFIAVPGPQAVKLVMVIGSV